MKGKTIYFWFFHKYVKCYETNATHLKLCCVKTLYRVSTRKLWKIIQFWEREIVDLYSFDRRICCCQTPKMAIFSVLVRNFYYISWKIMQIQGFLADKLLYLAFVWIKKLFNIVSTFLYFGDFVAILLQILLP